MCCKNQYKRHVGLPCVYVKRPGCAVKNNTNDIRKKHRPHRYFRHFGLGCAVKTVQTACRSFTSTSSMCCKNQYKRHVGLAAFTSTSRMCCKNHYKRHQHRPHRCFRHFECRMCCKNQYERHAQQKHRPHRRFRHFGLGCAVKAIQTACRSFTSTSSMCCKNQCKRHVGLRAFTSDGAVKTTTNGTNIGHTGVFGTSGAGCAVKKVGANVL